MHVYLKANVDHGFQGFIYLLRQIIQVVYGQHYPALSRGLRE